MTDLLDRPAPADPPATADERPEAGPLGWPHCSWAAPSTWRWRRRTWPSRPCSGRCSCCPAWSRSGSASPSSTAHAACSGRPRRERACIGAWALSRTVGLPLAGHAGEVEDATVVDGACVVLELVTAIVAALVRCAERRGAFLRSTTVAVMVCVGSLAIMTSALAAPSARDHAMPTARDHAHDEADAHPHAAEDDLGFAALGNGQMGAHTHPGDATADAATDPEISPEDAATLAGQLVLTAPLVQPIRRSPTPRPPGTPRPARSRRASGCTTARRSTGWRSTPTGDRCRRRRRRPAHLRRHRPRRRPAGFMFMAYQETEPEGFAGPSTAGTSTMAVCVRYGPSGVETPFGADLSDVTDEM